MSQKSFIVLGVSHRVQGATGFIRAFHDPTYDAVVREIISQDRIDFVGEECGDMTTVAQTVAHELLGAGHHLNVDPLVAEFAEYGIGETYSAPSIGQFPVHRWSVADSEKRELIWVERLIARTAARGLLICGFYHAFSVAAKLLNRGFEVEARTYMPWEKLGRGTGC